MLSRACKAAPWALLALGALFIVLGVVRGEPATVIKKAVRVCLECIGLG